MSWETLLVLNVDFNDRAKPEEVERFEEVVREVFQVGDGEIGWDGKSLKVSSLSLPSQIGEEGCSLFAKYASRLDFVEALGVSLYCLDSGYSIYFNRETGDFTVDRISLTSELNMVDDGKIRGCFERQFPP